jgi:hypothetical protein
MPAFSLKLWSSPIHRTTGEAILRVEGTPVFCLQWAIGCKMFCVGPFLCWQFWFTFVVLLPGILCQLMLHIPYSTSWVMLEHVPGIHLEAQSLYLSWWVPPPQPCISMHWDAEWLVIVQGCCLPLLQSPVHWYMTAITFMWALVSHSNHSPPPGTFSHLFWPYNSP